MPDVAIHALREVPQFRDIVADRIWRAFWAPSGAPLSAVEEALGGCVGPDDYPFTLVALSEGRFAGTVTAIASDVAERPQYTPWLAALWVEPDCRGQGLAVGLMEAGLARLASHGFGIVYLAARERMRPFYGARGWQLIESGVGPDRLDVFSRPLR